MIFVDHNHQHLKFIINVGYKATTYLRCHTYPLLCRCPACGEGKDNGSLSVALNKRTPSGDLLYLGDVLNSLSIHQASGSHLNQALKFKTLFIYYGVTWFTGYLEYLNATSKYTECAFFFGTW